MTDPDIELIDVSSPEDSSRVDETVSTSETGQRKGVAVLVVVMVAAAIALLTTGGNDEATAPTTQPTVTTSPVPSTTNRVSRTSLPAPVIGPGPPLVWERVEFEINSTDFGWVGEGFASRDGESEYLLRPNGTLTVSDLQTGPSEPDIQSSLVVTGDGSDNPTELTVGRTEQITIVPMPSVESDLVDPVLELQVERTDDRFLVLHTLGGTLDLDLFRERTGSDLESVTGITVGASIITISGNEGREDLPIDGLDLEPDDITALRSIGEPIQQLSIASVGGQPLVVDAGVDRIQWIAAVDGDFVVSGLGARRSGDGIDWVDTGDGTPRLGGLNAPGPNGVLTGLTFDGEDGFISTSTDAGDTWQQFARPMSNTWSIDSVGSVIATTGWRSDPFLPTTSPWSVLTPEFALSFDDNETTFSLETRDGETILSGVTTDPANGFRFAPGSSDIWFVDPDTGDEIARFDRAAFALALPATLTLRGDPQLVGFADSSAGVGVNLEWALITVDELFGPEALAVDFVPGDGWLLADVTTRTGRDLYMAEVPASP